MVVVHSSIQSYTHTVQSIIPFDSDTAKKIVEFANKCANTLNPNLRLIIINKSPSNGFTSISAMRYIGSASGPIIAGKDFIQSSIEANMKMVSLYISGNAVTFGQYL